MKIELQIVDLDPPQGELRTEAAGSGSPFSGWIELMALLDAAVAAAEPTCPPYPECEWRGNESG